MCGIIGYVGTRQVVPLLVDGLKLLEYRGYDSAGVAVIESDSISRCRRPGKVRDLERDLEGWDSKATVGIGHTRWATHGRPTEENAHPHFGRHERIAVVHNGIIENYLPLRERLIEEGHQFSSETDTEVLAHLIESHFEGDLMEAVRAAVKQAKGAFAVAVISADTPDRIVVARRGSPLVLGRGQGETYVASDVPALLGRASEVQFLGEDELAELTIDGFRMIDFDGQPVERPSRSVSADPISIQKGGYKHFMLKEIHEQGRAVGETLREKVNPEEEGLFLPALDTLSTDFDHVYLVACGTAFHASLAAEYLWEQVLRVPIQAVIASEFRGRTPALSPRTLVVAVSQSGETIDTLMAVRRAKEGGASVIALVNNEHSAIDRESDAAIYMRAGIEIGVAASKTFTAQLAALGVLGLRLAERRSEISADDVAQEIARLALLPGRISECMQQEEATIQIAERLHHVNDVLFLARGVLFPIALEGALKLKEISYIHAEGYPAGEMKHGPIALIDEETPAVFLLSDGYAYDKVLSNMEEVKARNGHVIAVTDTPDAPAVRRLADDIIPVPMSEGISRPILFTIPLQLLAYHTAVWRGTDVDQPRNLAKTVTVE